MDASSEAQREVTTTHAASGGGNPRLVLEKAEVWQGEGQPEFRIVRSLMLVGSDSACDIVLPDLEPLHAVVLHGDDDEYVLANCGPETRVHGAVVVENAILRTGARIDLGPHSLAFARDESADHGRPYGGRSGGEFGHQFSQPPRDSVQEGTTRG